MSFVPRLSALLVTAAVLAGLLAIDGAAAGVGTDARAALSKSGKKGAKKKCGKGKATKSAAGKGKKARKCKKKGKKTAAPSPAPPAPGPAGGPFAAPGRVLEGEEAKGWVGKYLANSTFTDCPAGWPNCAVEQRYSHSSGSAFYYCRLTSSSGSDIRSEGEYGLQAAKVEADGGWTVRVVTYSYGNYSTYEWQVAANGIVRGAYQYQPSSSVEQIGPLQYLGGVAKDCSY